MTRGGVLRGRRGTLCHRWSPCVARVGPGDIDFAFLWFSQSGLAQLFCSFLPWLCFCAPFSARWSVLPAQLPKSIKTDLPSSSALHLLSCAPCSFWLSVLAAQRPKSLKSDLPSSSTDYNVHVPVHTQARQPHHTRAGGGSLSFLSLVLHFVR